MLGERLGIGIANGLGTVTGNIYAFGGFVVGSILVGRFMHGRKGPFLRVALEALIAQLAIFIALAVVLGAVDIADHSGWRYGVCFVLAAAMGIQTGVARHMSVKDVNTTVATMTAEMMTAAAAGDPADTGAAAAAMATTT